MLIGKSCEKKLLLIESRIRYRTNNTAQLLVETEPKSGKPFSLPIIYLVHSLLCTAKMNLEPSRAEKFENLKFDPFLTSNISLNKNIDPDESF